MPFGVPFAIGETIQMRIEIDVHLAEDDRSHQWLDRILHKITDGWHLWDTGKELDVRSLENTAWVNGRIWVLELLQKTIERSAWDFELHHRQIRVTSRPSNANELSPEDAARFAERPLYILVENRYSDGLFLKRIVKELHEGLFRLWTQEKDAIQVDSIGGVGQMKKGVEDKASCQSVRPRMVVIADSDKKSPSDYVGKAVKKLQKKCERYNVSCWILAKRAIENYLPQGPLTDCRPEKTELIDAWSKLSEDQKDFYNMKKGLPRNRNDCKNSLFAGLSNEDYEYLIGGFGDNIYKCWEKSDEIVKSELLVRSRGDLEYGIHLICKEV